MIAELIEWRLGDYLARTSRNPARSIRCKVSHANGRPIIFFNRDQHPELPQGPTPFTADGEAFQGNFAKIALNVATRYGEDGNALHDLLRQWFGPAAGLPGTSNHVELVDSDDGWIIRPVRLHDFEAGEAIPLLPSYAVACGAVDTPQDIADASTLTVVATQDSSLDPSRHFVAFADGNSMNGGPKPVQTGDPLLFRWARDISRDDLIGHRVLVQELREGKPSGMLKRLAKDGPRWILQSDGQNEAPIEATADLRIVAVLEDVLDQARINPLGTMINEDFTREQVPALFGAEYNYGKWGQSGHISHERHEVLFVTLDKEGMGAGKEYHDAFEGPDRFRWSSQNAVGPATLRGQKILNSPGNGQLIHLFCRQTNRSSSGAVPFTYYGLVVPLSHRDNKPMSVQFRLLSPRHR